jgi:hypothetical protein
MAAWAAQLIVPSPPTATSTPPCPAAARAACWQACTMPPRGTSTNRWRRPAAASSRAIAARASPSADDPDALFSTMSHSASAFGRAAASPGADRTADMRAA